MTDMDKQMKKILIVDDDEQVRFNLTTYLKDEGYEVLNVPSAMDALALIERQHFDLAIVDMRMPGMNGEELIMRINQVKPGLRYIIHTGSLGFSVPEDLAQIGINPDDVVTKPIKDFELFSRKVKAMVS